MRVGLLICYGKRYVSCIPSVFAASLKGTLSSLFGIADIMFPDTLHTLIRNDPTIKTFLVVTQWGNLNALWGVTVLVPVFAFKARKVWL